MDGSWVQRLSLYSYFTSTTRSKQSWTADDDAYYDAELYQLLRRATAPPTAPSSPHAPASRSFLALARRPLPRARSQCVSASPRRAARHGRTDRPVGPSRAPRSSHALAPPAAARTVADRECLAASSRATATPTCAARREAREASRTVSGKRGSPEERVSVSRNSRVGAPKRPIWKQMQQVGSLRKLALRVATLR